MLQPAPPPVPPAPPTPPAIPEIVFAGGGPPIVEAAAIILIAIIAGLVLYPLARALARRIEGGARAGDSAEAQARLERLEQSVDAMAIEIERISEGQRYTTKLLTERLPLAVKIPDAKSQDKTLL